jgi:hypothetical protein
MMDANHTSMDKPALALCLGGSVVATGVAIFGKILSHNFTMMACGIFAAFQFAAFVLGLMARPSPLAKTVAITSIPLLGPLLLIGYDRWTEPPPRVRICYGLGGRWSAPSAFQRSCRAAVGDPLRSGSISANIPSDEHDSVVT